MNNTLRSWITGLGAAWAALGLIAPSDQAAAAGDTVVLAECDSSPYVIVIADSPGEAEQFAASELQKYVKHMAGAELPIKAESEPHDGPRILIGRVAAADDSGFIPKARYKEDDAYRIGFRADDLYIVGSRPRGTLFGVYDVLERLGTRWFAPGYRFYKGMHESVPPRSRLTLPASLDVSEMPAFKFRQEFVEHFYLHEPDDVVALVDWAAKNRINAVAVRVNEFSAPWYRVLAPEMARRDLMLAVEGHGFERFLSRSTYYHDHPDWFGPVKGENSDHYFDQFRLTDPEALAAYQRNLHDFLRDFPGIYSLAIMPNDSPRWTDTDLERFSPAELQRKTYELAAKVINEVSPGIRLSIYLGVSYFGNDGMDVWKPPSTRVLWHTAVLRRSQKYAWNDPANELNASQYQKAAEITRILVSKGEDVMWSSRYAPFRDISLPGLIYAEQMASELRDLRVLGGSGIDFNYAIPPSWIPYELKHLLFARLAWNPGEDVGDMMTAYYRARFPESAESMEAFYTLLRRAMERYAHPGGGYSRDEAYGLYPADRFDQAFAELKEARAHLDRAMQMSGRAEVQQLIWLLGASLEYGRRKLEIDFLAQSGRREEAARGAAEMMDFAEHWSSRGIIYDSSFLRMRLERRFLGPWPDLPIKGLPPDNKRVYEFKDFVSPAGTDPLQPEDTQRLE